jgi:UDPglucose--hexose-1-phosphate uridylyltransferase
MNEIRWNALLSEWVIVAGERQRRPVSSSKKECPFCPGDHERHPGLPQNYDFIAFENLYPALTSKADILTSSQQEDPFFTSAQGYGAAEVVLYSSDHSEELHMKSVERIKEILDLLEERYMALSARKGIEYVMIFENRGPEVGVTLAHPHCQIYAFPFVPPLIVRERVAIREYRMRKNSCLICDIVEAERRKNSRVVTVTDDFIAFVPFAARFPYEVHIAPFQHHSDLSTMNGKKRSLAWILKAIRTAYDELWNRPMPFMMLFYQDSSADSHFHIEFLPVRRAADKIKYFAGVEMGAGTYTVEVLPETAAGELRDRIEQDQLHSRPIGGLA